jgi:hypothetical protein
VVDFFSFGCGYIITAGVAIRPAQRPGATFFFSPEREKEKIREERERGRKTCL